MLQDQREKTRILFKYTFEFESIDGQKFLGIGADFSETGLSFFSFQPVKEGTELKFNLTFPSDGLKFSITGFVKNTLSGIKKGSSVEELFALRLCHACNQVFEHTELRCPRCKSTYFEVLGDGFEAIEQNIYWIGAKFDSEEVDSDFSYRAQEMLRQLTELEGKTLAPLKHKGMAAGKVRSTAFLGDLAIGGAFLVTETPLELGKKGALLYVESGIDDFVLPFRALSHYHLEQSGLELNGYVICFEFFSLHLNKYLGQVKKDPSNNMFCLLPEKK